MSWITALASPFWVMIIGSPHGQRLHDVGGMGLEETDGLDLIGKAHGGRS
jgi:hypothetical protein